MTKYSAEHAPIPGQAPNLRATSSICINYLIHFCFQPNISDRNSCNFRGNAEALQGLVCNIFNQF